MPPQTHAILSASSAHRWLHCTPSARLEQGFEDRETEAAAEGTAAHALCEHKLRLALGQPSEKPVSRFDCAEMEAYTDDYAQFVQEVMQTCANPLVLIEQRLDFSDYVPGGFGTGDCVIISDGTLHIIDFKYGQGVLVECERNPQMMLYALGALAVFDALYDIDEVAMTIFQPRRENVSTWTIPVTALKEWAEKELKPKAALAYDGKGDYCAGAWCMFCRAAVKCRARAEAQLKLAKYDFALPPLLTDEEIEDILGRLDSLVGWAKSISEYALDAALHGKHWNGWKLVEGRSNRKYTDETAVAEAASAAGYEDIYRKTLLPITDMERYMGKKNFQAVLGNLVVKPQGKPTLVPESDKRPAMNNAENDFEEEKHE